MVDNNIFNYNINDGFLWSEVNLKGERKYYVEGYASTIDQDKAGETILMSAQNDILNQIMGENITMDIEHEEWYDDNGKILQRPKNEKIPVAKIVHAEMRPRGVWVKAEINTNLNSFKQVWGSIKDNFLKAFSVAFYPIKKNGGLIENLNLVNITLTGSPVNPNATFAASMKSAQAWMDSQDLKATAPKNVELINPADTQSQSVDNPADTPQAPDVKNTEDNKMECKKCDKEFADKEAYDEHMEKVHKVEEPEKKGCVKAEEVVSEEVPATESQSETIDATIKAMKDAQEAEMTAMKAEIASLKAELAKPVMKAQVETKMPETAPVFNAVSPLQLVR